MRVSRTTVAIVAGVIFALALALAFALGKLSSPAPTTPVAQAVAARSVVAVAAPRASEQPQPIAQPSIPSLTLATITRADWDALGTGCVCSLSVGGKEKFIAGGDDIAIVRPNGVQRSCPIDNDKLQEMFDGESLVTCGDTTVRISPFGKVAPGEDGHSSKARMRVSDSGASTKVTGDWACGC